MIKKLFITSIIILFLTITPSAYAAISEGPLSSFSGSVSISNPQPAPGTTVILRQTIRNNGSQTLSVKTAFSVHWGLNQVLITPQSASCDGALTGLSFEPAYGMSSVDYFSTAKDFPAGVSANCTCFLKISSSVQIGETFSYSGSLSSSQGGYFSKQLGGGQFTIGSGQPAAQPPTQQIQPSLAPPPIASPKILPSPSITEEIIPEEADSFDESEFEDIENKTAKPLEITPKQNVFQKIVNFVTKFFNKIFFWKKKQE